jgi:hypothetical protein
MISPQTVDLQIVGERQRIGKRLASSGERPLSACVGKATAGYDIECGEKRLREDLSSVWRMRASMPVATVATQSVRHRSPV